MKINFLAVIPARYASSRFPGKPLANIKGKTMIQRVYERTKMVFPIVYVATDDERIENEVQRFGGNVVMTSENHQSGTDRCWEASQKISGDQAALPVPVFSTVTVSATLSVTQNTLKNSISGAMP